MVFSPSASITTAVDYWNLTISDAVLQKPETAVFSDPVQYKDNFYRYDPAAFPAGYNGETGAGVYKGSVNPNFPIAYVYLPYENVGKLFAAGLDFNVQTKTKLESGTFGVSLDGTLFTKHGYQYNGLKYVSDVGGYKDFGPAPRWRHSLTFAYSTGPWNASVTNNYTSGYQDYTDPLAAISAAYPAVRMVNDYSLWDAQLGWKGIKNLDVVVGVKNLLDQDPPSSRTSKNFQVGYDAQWTNPLGRTYYTRLRYKFL